MALRDTWLSKYLLAGILSQALVLVCFHRSAGMQTLSPRYLSGSPEKQALTDAFVGKPIASLRTPAFVVDRAIFAANCARMHQNVASWGADFRAHIKTHKVYSCVESVPLKPNISLEDGGGYKTPVSFRRRQNELYHCLNTNGGMESCRRWSGIGWDRERCVPCPSYRSSVKV